MSQQVKSLKEYEERKQPEKQKEKKAYVNEDRLDEGNMKEELGWLRDILCDEK